MANFRRTTLALTAIATLAACRPSDDSNANNAAGPTENIGAPTVLPVADPALDREQLLLAVMRAASAAAVGRDDLDIQRKLDGKPFKIALRFACPSAAASQQPAAASQQPDAATRREDSKETLRLSARPDVTLDDPLLSAIGASEAFEAVDGFWIKRPWLLNAACPIVPPAPTAPDPGEEADGEGRKEKGESAARAETADAAGTGSGVAAQQRIAIAQFYSSTDTRAGRRTDRPYEAVVTPAADNSIERTGFDLVLSGRLRALPNGKVIQCVATDPRRPPDCILSATFDQVRMEHPETRALLAQWAQ